VTGTIFAASVLMFMAAGIAVARPFLGRTPEALSGHARRPRRHVDRSADPRRLSLWFGVFSDVPETWIVAPGDLGGLRIDPVEVDLYLFREVNAAFILSLVTFARASSSMLAQDRFAPSLRARSRSARSSSIPAGTARSTG
jgi:multicomponent Na+:H+ antiporter subunit A